MSEASKRCMICAKPSETLKGGICQPCQERIRQEALGEQAGVAQGAEREIARHGIAPIKKQPG